MLEYLKAVAISSAEYQKRMAIPLSDDAT